MMQLQFISTHLVFPFDLHKTSTFPLKHRKAGPFSSHSGTFVYISPQRSTRLVLTGSARREPSARQLVHAGDTPYLNMPPGEGVKIGLVLVNKAR